MFDAFQLKIFELYNRLIDLKDREQGQTSAEYVAVTAVAVLIAIGIVYVSISGAINTAASNIFTKLDSWVTAQFP